MQSSLLMERFCSTIPTSQHTNDDHLPAKCRRRPARRLRPVPCHPGTCPCPVLVRMDQYGGGTAGAGKLRHLLRLTFAATHVRPRRDQRPACSNLRIQPACADSLQQRGVALARRGTTWHGHGSVTTPARRHARSRASTRRDQRPVFCGSTHPTGPLKFPASGRPGVSDGAWCRFAATWVPARYSRAGAPDGSPAWGRTVRPEGRRLRPGS